MPPESPEEYGHDRFIRMNGKRLRVRMVRTIQPKEVETNAAFERRMEQMIDALEQMSGILRVEYEFERRAGSITQCRIEADHEPREACVLEDSRPAGGRTGTPRSRRAA